MVFAAGALVVGLGLGLIVVGPRLGGGAAPAAATAGAEGHEGKGDQKVEARRIFRLDNIIVNPAGTQGQRFLIVSVAVEVTSEAAEARLKASEVPFRDAVTGMIERMTLTQLTQVGARDSVKAGVLEFAKKYAAASTVHVYLPQFLIQ